MNDYDDDFIHEDDYHRDGRDALDAGADNLVDIDDLVDAGGEPSADPDPDLAAGAVALRVAEIIERDLAYVLRYGLGDDCDAATATAVQDALDRPGVIERVGRRLATCIVEELA